MPRTAPPGSAAAIPTTLPIVYSPHRAEHQILVEAERQIHRIQATSLPDDVKADRIEEYFTKAGRDLERLAKHRLRVVYLRPARGGGQ